MTEYVAPNKGLTFVWVIRALFFTGCMPTVAKMSETVTIGPNGEKTVSITKELSQSVSNTQTSSTDQVLEKFK
jgi:hypothetical protein